MDAGIVTSAASVPSDQSAVSVRIVPNVRAWKPVPSRKEKDAAGGVVVGASVVAGAASLKVGIAMNRGARQV